VFATNLGLKNTTLDLHENQVVAPKLFNEAHVKGIPLLVAQAIFRYHIKNSQNIINIIVGRHGEDILKNGMLAFINSLPGLSAVVDEQNSGQLNISKTS
jgi:hypothetical protein